jgi:hypothetical protein
MVPDDKDRRDGETPVSGPEEERPPGEDHGELRFEGPISMEEDEYEDEYERSSGGRTFLLTAIIAIAVVLIVAIALLLRDDPGREQEEFADLGVAAEESPSPEAGEPMPSGDATAGAQGDEGLRFRSVPTDETSEAGTEPARDETAAPEPAPEPVQPETTEPEAAEEPTPAPAERERALPENVSPEGVGELARAGRVGEAAQLGRRLAASGNPSHYTLQVLLACDPGNVQRAFERVRDPRLTVLPASYQGRSCYRLCWGDYAGPEKARAAAGTVDPYFDANPVPRPWGDLLR